MQEHIFGYFIAWKFYKWVPFSFGNATRAGFINPSQHPSGAVLVLHLNSSAVCGTYLHNFRGRLVLVVSKKNSLPPTHGCRFIPHHNLSCMHTWRVCHNGISDFREVHSLVVCGGDVRFFGKHYSTLSRACQQWSIPS